MEHQTSQWLGVTGHVAVPTKGKDCKISRGPGWALATLPQDASSWPALPCRRELCQEAVILTMCGNHPGLQHQTSSLSLPSDWARASPAERALGPT